MKDNESAVIANGAKVVSIESLSAKNCRQLNFSDLVKDFKPEISYAEFSLTSGVNELGGGTTIFVPAKEFQFLNPEINISVEENESSFLLNIQSTADAKSVGIDLEKSDCIFSYNYFDISANSVKVVEVKKSSFSKDITIGQFKEQLKTVSVYDIA